MQRLLIVMSCALIVPHSLIGGVVDYPTQIKPILAARCYACHGALRQRAGLRLDTAALLGVGGESGAAIEPGNSQASLLISMITGESGTRMPPEEEGAPLTSDQIALIREWIDQGAQAPDEPTPADPRKHWSYQPVVRPAVPAVQNPSWVSNPIDAFIASGHASHGLVPVAAADKATLLRRVYFDLVGLPPTPDELAAFLTDDSPGAYERIVDRLLDSPQYGERWARHWMDVWRYSDWAGYEQEIRNSARHIWRWRDWIIESINADKGYDRMVLEMLAGDEIAPTDPGTLRATGSLARNWYKFNRNTWLDTTVEHTAKAFLGVTMNCCRCHDHKYDPISQLEYYELRAIFEPYDVRTDRVPGEPDLMRDGLPRVCDLKPDEPTYLFERGNELRPDKSRRLAPRVPEALGGAFVVEPVELPVLARYPALREFALAEDLAAAARRVDDCQAARTKAQTAVDGALQTLTELTKPSAMGVDEEVFQHATEAMDTAVSSAELATISLATARAAQAALAARIAAEKAKYGLTPGEDMGQLALAAGNAERELALCESQETLAAAQQVVAQTKATTKPMDDAARQAIAAAEKKLAAAKTTLASAHAALAHATEKYQPLGDVLPPMSTGRRLAFARWIVDRQNPRAARVAINHIWLRHFGAPLVANMFDFGLRCPPPGNQPLLDWLAAELMDHGWQMKRIHRLIVTSNTYRMQSGGHATGVDATNVQSDPDNQFLWRANPRRLEAEIVRDALFFVAGSLDLTCGGPDIDCIAAANTPRRSIYFRHAYEKQMKFLELFDGPSTNECYRRSESVVPLQALALANSDVAIDQSRLLAQRLSLSTADEPAPQRAFIRLAFRQILNREPSETELAECEHFLAAQAELLEAPDRLTAVAGSVKSTVAPSAVPQQRARENLVHVLMNHNDFVTVR